MPKILFRFSFLFALIFIVCHVISKMAEKANEDTLGWILLGGLALIVLLVLILLAPLIKEKEQ